MMQGCSGLLHITLHAHSPRLDQFCSPTLMARASNKFDVYALLGRHDSRTACTYYTFCLYTWRALFDMFNLPNMQVERNNWSRRAACSLAAMGWTDPRPANQPTKSM